jgi:hypothetical protein
MGTLKHADLTEITRDDWKDESSHLIGGQPDLDIVRTAACVVASTNASTTQKAMADIVCGTDYATDELAIKAANDTSSSHDVLLIGKTFNCGALTIDRCLLHSLPETTLNMTGTLTVGHTSTAQGRLALMKIAYVAGYASSGILLNGLTYPYTNLSHYLLNHLYIYFADRTAGGVPLLLQAITSGSTNAAVALSNISDIVINGGETCMKLLGGMASPATAGYVNGMNFSNIVLQNGKYLLTLDADTYKCQGNLFNNIQLQPHATETIDGITLSGGAYCGGNQFYGVKTWDWELASGYALKIANLCTHNLFIGDFAGSVSDANSTTRNAQLGNFNTIIDIYNGGGQGNVGRIPITEIDLPHQGFTNLLTDGGCEAENLPAWTVSGAGATFERDGTEHTEGVYSGKLTRVGTNATATQTITDANVPGKYYTSAAKVKCSVASRAYIMTVDSTGAYTSSSHSGDGSWQTLTATHLVAAGATWVRFQFSVLTGDTSANIDEAIMVEGKSCPAFK